MGTATVSKSKRSKTTKSALAVVLALLLALGGTFAWTSFSQRANNQFQASANPGGRLHDDFIWTAAEKNKDVYVENFGDPGEGPNIYARVQLREYLEKGAGAGPTSTSTTLEKVPTDANKQDNITWQPYNFKEPDSAIHNNFKLLFGGQTVYMPTFNKDKDSVEPDINGSLYENNKMINYTNHVDYELGETKTGTEQLASGRIRSNVMHTVAKTQNSTVMSMTDWQAEGSPVGRYWVYDDKANDGWFYWAQAITPGTATGLLLDNVLLTNRIGKDWYYQIDAIGEFITEEELIKENASGKYFFDKAGEKEIKVDAYNLLKNAIDVSKEASAVLDAPVAMENASGSEVELEGKSYYKLAQDGSKVMLMTKNAVSDVPYNDGTRDNQKVPFGTSNVWNDAGCTARLWCNGAYYNSLPGFTRTHIVDSTYKTREALGTRFITTTSKVFLLTEADVSNSAMGDSKPSADWFTYWDENQTDHRLVPESLLTTKLGDGAVTPWSLRSVRYDDSSIGVVTTAGGISSTQITTFNGMRPAFWIDLAS